MPDPQRGYLPELRQRVNPGIRPGRLFILVQQVESVPNAIAASMTLPDLSDGKDKARIKPRRLPFKPGLCSRWFFMRRAACEYNGLKLGNTRS